jgi:hypothetical protein
MTDANKDASKKVAPPKQAAEQAAILERATMKRWMRLTARKHSVGKTAENSPAEVAADAIAQLLGKKPAQRP